MGRCFGWPGPGVKLRCLVRSLDGMTVTTTLFRFDDSYAREVPGLSVSWVAAPVPAPELLVLNEELAIELGADPAALREPLGVLLLVGQAPGGVTTVAQAYAGHQFGIYVPRLGDGRALLLGEVIDIHGRRRDLHLKGSGRTPFARGGDGKAAVGPMLREYLIGEAMQGLRIPTTRALAVVATGERVFRERALPGAVLTRVAASHLRVGTFQYPAASGDRDWLRALAYYAIARHHPEAADDPNRYLDLFRRVAGAQASLVARWMVAGFVHGVMNTDNTTISGETIDYGPCAFMDAYDPATVFSSIDHGGRYAYGNQPAIMQWNLARLAETQLPLNDENSEAAAEAAPGGLSGGALAGRITPAGRPRAARRTSPTAAPEHGVRRYRRLIGWLVRSRQACLSLATFGGQGFPRKSPSRCSGEQAPDAGDRGSPRRGKGGRGRWVGRRGPTKMAKELRGARSGASSQRFCTRWETADQRNCW